MGFMRLGSQNTTPPPPTAATCGSGRVSSKPQNIFAAKKKTNDPSPTTAPIRNKNHSSDNNSNSTKDQSATTTNNSTRITRTTRTVWSTARERGQAIIRTTTRSPAKQNPHITTISTTRSKSSNNHTARSPSRAQPTTATTSTSTSTSTSTTPQPPLPPPSLTLSPPQTTNPSTHDTPPPLPPPSLLSPRPGSATTSLQLQSRQRPRPRPLSLAAAGRPALNLRDQNAAPVLAPVLKENKNMDHENSLNPSTSTNSRLQMPSLSATAARGINRTPLTPKIASASRTLQSQTSSVSTAAATPKATVATTPLPRRAQRPASFIATNNGSNQALYDDPSTVSAAAFSPHLNSNVTPRSGSRQNRVDSASSTPTGTPNHDRSDAFPFSPDMGRRPMVTFDAVSPERNMPMKQDITNSRDSKFFHASDAKMVRPMSASKMVSPKNPTFFYANGNGIGSKPTSPATLSPPLSPGLNRSQESKFMYANGTPEVRPSPQPTLSRGSGSNGSSSSKGPPVRPTMASRSVSPSKLPLHSQPSYRNSTGSQSAIMHTAAASTTRGQVSPPLMSPNPALRRPGTATSRSSGHSRSGSLVKGDGTAESLKSMTSPAIGLFPPANLSPTKAPPLTLASIIQAAEEFTENEPDLDHEDEHEHEHEDAASPGDQSVLQSPTKSNGSSADPLTELIANARRERKVQDLQIRNASLEAINRTLERQMRKQTAELRRFRRLSRAGHLSLASTTLSSRAPSGAVSELELESIGLSDLSEEDLSMRELEDESLSDTESISSDLSASVLEARDEKHRERDEERLKLDLSKHQQILIDSQKINQSIKRCLNWTEELINEGKKALEYQVRVSDIRLGGRVLDPLDEEEESSKLPLPDDMAAAEVKPTEEVAEPPATWGTEPQDRDSGIELPRDGD
ncbi:hypothetical protein RRF57_010563 [Xylaria bambusicola]|uniref:Uncharacterized protein n=1 Tax=Xylaria bambusicola TaxID=326684 RepID=A0AAN7Z2V4_9PEZI